MSEKAPSQKPDDSEAKPTDGQGDPSTAGGADSPVRKRPAASFGWTLLPLALLLALFFTTQLGEKYQQVRYAFFLQELRADNVAQATINGGRLTGEFKTAPEVEVKEEKADKPKQGAKDEPEPSKPAPKDEEEPAKQSEEPAKAKEEKTTKPANEEDSKASPAPVKGEQQDAKKDEKKKPETVTLSTKFYVELPDNKFAEAELMKELSERNVDWTNKKPFPLNSLMTFIWFLLLIGMVLFMFTFMRRARDQMMGGGMLGSVTKSPARRYSADEGPKVTFDDVAGLKGVKSDLKEIVEFLRDPAKFQQLGATIPKGVLLNGPPGTGKTLLAKAIAGEAGVPFFAINGSEFIQMFVGVGASRVRDMFKNAKRNAPAILFIDEIDAVGRQRGAGLGGGHDEREQTLNQILSEMDGFSPSETVIVIAATNRPDVLDPALLRPGRFDRHITVDRPTLEGRRQLFDVHTRETPLGEDVDFDRLARATVGMTGADIRNLCNEAALWATRQDRKFVTMEDFEYARDKTMMGATREEVLSEEEKRVTAYHEAGHALVAWLLPDCDRVHKVTVIPRGRALGVTQLTPDEDRYNVPQSRMQAMLAMMLAGRAAEKIEYEEFSAGAENDLQRATSLARRMVTHWGMSERLGPVAYYTDDANPFLGREIVQEHRHYSEHTAQIIDEEVAKILHNAADRARTLLAESRDKLNSLSNALMEQEELDEDEITELIGPPAQGARPPVGGSLDIAPPAPTPAPSRESTK